MPSRFATINRNIRLDFNHRVYFTRDSFSATNETLADILQPSRKGQPTKAIVYLDEGILDGMPNLPEQIESYFRSREDRLDLVCSPKFAPGGEPAKNNFQYIEQIWADLNDYAMCRHSYVIVIGGGAALFRITCSIASVSKLASSSARSSICSKKERSRIRATLTASIKPARF